MEGKELDLTAMHMVQDAHNAKINVEKVIEKSVGNNKKQRIWGELYKGKKVTLDEIKTYTAIALAAVAAIGSITLVGAGINHLERRSDEITGFRMAVRNEAEDKLDDVDALLFNTGNDLSNKEILDLVDQAISDLDADAYKFNGSRKDGTHNTNYDLNNGEVLNLREIEKDAIDNAVEDVVDDYIRSHK